MFPLIVIHVFAERCTCLCYFFLNKTLELWRVWGYSPYISYTSYVKVFQVSNNQCWRFTKSTSLQHLPKLYYLSLWEIYQRLFYQDWEKSPLGPFFHYIGKTTAGEGDRGGFNGTITKNMLFNNSFYGELETTAYIGTPPPCGLLAIYTYKLS